MLFIPTLHFELSFPGTTMFTGGVNVKFYNSVIYLHSSVL